MKKLTTNFVFILFALTSFIYAEEETFPKFADGTAPTSFKELWKGVDPRKEPLDVEVLKEWEEDGVILKVLRYRVGIFKGKKAMMAAVYGYPKNGSKLPALVQIHGGGQYADYKAPLSNAKRGYATISIAWAGRISAPNYNVNPNIVKLFWEDKKDDPQYKLTTDWGALDVYHAPSREGKDAFTQLPTYDWSYDSVASPRNCSWVLAAYGARRAITFLEKQAVVDADKIGVYGHSMGGKLTVLTTGSDKRVKAAAPSCGGISHIRSADPLFRATIGDDAYLKEIKVPIIFLSPANDFHGLVKDLPAAIQSIQSKEWRITSAPHHQHQDTDEYEVATQLWFDQHLKGKFIYPETPILNIGTNQNTGVPTISIDVDASKQIERVDLYYTQNGKLIEKMGERDDTNNSKNKFWYHSKAKKVGESYVVKAPIFSEEKPFWIYANVTYKMTESVAGVGYYYGAYNSDKYVVSSKINLLSPDHLRVMRIKGTLQSTSMIEDFSKDWEREWFSYRPENWSRSTHKVYDDRYKAPHGSRLVVKVKSEQVNKLVVVLNDYAVEVDLKGNNVENTFELKPENFKNAEAVTLKNWKDLHTLKLSDSEVLRKGRGKDQKIAKFGAQWKGESPSFQSLYWK